MSRTTIAIAAALALAVTLPAVSAQAQAPRTFVSAAGSDNNPCSFAAPCRHFQAAVDTTSAGGEVDALDPAGYGPIVISQAVTIEGQGWSYIAPPANGNGITINAVGGDVSIHGVSINGAGIAGGTDGIVFNSGASLTVTDCVARDFNFTSGNTGIGILIQPTSGNVRFIITNTLVSNSFTGINYFFSGAPGAPAANGTIDHVVATNNNRGIDISSSGEPTSIAISNSIASNNLDTGIHVTGTSAVAVSIDNSNISSNGFFGVAAVNDGSSPKVLLGRSVITSNFNNSINNQSSTFFTYQNNQINLNGNSNQVGGNALVALPFQ